MVVLVIEAIRFQRGVSAHATDETIGVSKSGHGEMDIHHFLNSRIAFIRQLFATASEPYVERKRKIKAQEPPFVPPYSEDDEPPFLDEWLEADESLQILAYSCISMLAASLHLYLESWVKQSRVPVDASMQKAVFGKKGWFAGYDAHFTKHFGSSPDRVGGLA